MKSSKFYLNFLFFFFFFIYSYKSYSQEECNCKLISDKISENIKVTKDSLEVFSKIKPLINSKFKSCVFEGLTIEFHYYIYNRKTKSAYSILQKQIGLLNKMRCNDQYDYTIYSNKAIYYRVINNLEKLSIYAFKSLKEAEKSNDVLNQISSIQDIVYLFTRMNEHKKNWPYVKRAQKLIESQKESRENAKHLLWLALEYEQKYTTTKRKTVLDSSLLFANKSKNVLFKNKMYGDITDFYRIKESYSYFNGDVKNALKYIDSSIFFAKKIIGEKNLASLYSSKAWDHLDNGQLKEANKWMDTALVTVNDIKDSSGKMMMYFDASDLYLNAKNIDKAFETYKVYSKMKDSVWNIEKVEKINELEQKYHKAKNEKMIFELEKTKQRYTFLIIGGLLAILTLIFFFRQRSLQSKQKIMETEQRLNRARINPHFFFNALASLQNVSLEEKSTKTTLFISRFAKIMRQSLESTYQELVTIETEIDFITQYLEIQKLRFPDKFDYQFHVDHSLAINELRIPGMIIQPFVENSIEHGFKGIDYKGMITITISDNNNIFSINISDNGVGRKFDEKEKDHKSRAMQIIKDRLYLFNKQNNSNASYQIQDVTADDGFNIIVSLPKIY